MDWVPHAGGKNETFSEQSFDEIVEDATGYLQQARGLLPTLALSIVILVVGCLLINCVSKYLQKSLLSMRVPRAGRSLGPFEEVASEDSEGEEEDAATKAVGKMDPTLVYFGMSIFKNFLRAILAITVCSMLGIETTSFLAIFTTSSLAVGLALQGQLTNFASGVMLILLNTFKVGDVIEVPLGEGLEGLSGQVIELSIFRTVLKVDEDKRHIIPNGKIEVVTILKECQV
mmetsp:Transcript_41696/g.96598  ORF Transcript_41696/g.96598 Transcript_41696/m.96598 type:complete len:230 (+) Transcript_41696:86-775(+)|eukprot:CAMPEP_0171105226 /NCGR_PEP_ID=MMETSP0766_2-20121228/62213_1 /TAXON_ID=439317 /ORGANISM="Gambierdiscus australes, Strain CAWD 149" /LENGTH=229 /DNA_ID=CAMNT_0011566017 /DNA_START=76 /DNA_END=765 /DNA_ORIENTATION=+